MSVHPETKVMTAVAEGRLAQLERRVRELEGRLVQAMELVGKVVEQMKGDGK